MEKSVIIEDPPKSSLNVGRVVAILGGAVAVLSVTLIITIACGTWYVGNLQESCDNEMQPAPNKHSTEKSEFDVEVKDEEKVNKEHVVVDEDKKTELTIIRAPETSHISHILTSDYNKRVVVIYESESNECFFVAMDVTDPSFQDTIDFLKRNNAYLNVSLKGGSVEPTESLNITAGEPLEERDYIPKEMDDFCSLRNSYWAEKEEEHTESRQKRAWCFRYCYRVCFWRYCYVRCGYRCIG